MVNELTEKDKVIDELESKITEAEEEGNEWQQQLNQVEATLTERTQELADAMEKATVAAAELEEHKLLAEQKISSMVEVDDVMTDMRHNSQHPELKQMLLKFEGVVSELKEELVAARDEAAKAKTEKDILYERESTFLTQKQTQQTLESNLATATTQQEAAAASLLRVERERDEALKELSESVTAHRRAAASLEAMKQPSTSAKAVWEATQGTLNEKIESLEGEIEILSRKLESETNNAERGENLFKEWRGKYHEESQKLAETTAELRALTDKCSKLEAQVEEMEAEINKLNEKIKEDGKKALEKERQRRNEVTEVEPLNTELQRLGKELEETRKNKEELACICFDHEEKIRTMGRENDLLDQDLREARHSSSTLEDVIADYQENISKLTDELSMHRKLAINGDTVGSVDVFTSKLTISQLEEEVNRLKKELGREDGIGECTEMSHNEGAVLSEIISRTLHKAAELLELCPELRKRGKVKPEMGMGKVAKMVEVLVRSLNRKMQIAEKYLTSFSGHLKQLRFVDDVHRDPVCMHLLSYHRTYWCLGAESAYSVLVAACYGVGELLDEEGATPEDSQDLVEQLTKARGDSDSLWSSTESFVPASTPTPQGRASGDFSALASPTPPPLSYDTPIRHATPEPAGLPSEELVDLKRQLSKFKAENKRLCGMIHRRNSEVSSNA